MEKVTTITIVQTQTEKTASGVKLHITGENLSLHAKEMIINELLKYANVENVRLSKK